MNNKQRLGLLVIISTLIRLVLANFTDLGNDEVYYWTYAKFPDWSHFDHPPMVGFFQQIFSLNLLFDSELALRLGFVVAGSLSTILLYLIGREIKDEKTGLIAAVLYNTSIYGFIISGLFIMPDGPLVLFWMSSCLFFLKFLKSNEKKKQQGLLMLSMLFAALAIYSKYQGVYLLFGYGLYILFFRRDLLKNASVYLSLGFSVLVLFIIFYWNYVNSFSGMSYHSERVTLFSLDFNLDTFLREFLGQIAYNNPYNYIVILLAVFSFKRKRFLEQHHFYFFLLISVPLIATTLFFSLYRDTLPHWSGVSFLSLAVLAAANLSERKNTPVLRFVLFFFFGLYLIALGIVNKGWFIDMKVNDQSEKVKLGKNDPTLDMYGWDQTKVVLEQLHNEDPQLATIPLVSNKWYPGSHLYYYVAAPLEKDLFVLGFMNDMHKYYWINQTMSPLQAGQDGIYITYSRNFKDPKRTMADYFEDAKLIKEFPIERSGKTVEYGFVYLLQSYKMTNLEGGTKE
ncbi:ArnT family glycosyltransferase [Lutimonas sp.]|uniref:ArnT family glycosyltransferase n=1 Tax=Lutimonas sp. TaxID=1872403 RepID=UPI003D9AC3A2